MPWYTGMIMKSYLYDNYDDVDDDDDDDNGVDPTYIYHNIIQHVGYLISSVVRYNSIYYTRCTTYRLYIYLFTYFNDSTFNILVTSTISFT